MTYYEILGVPENASNAEIRDAYRKLAKDYHPDKFKGSDRPFREIQEAWEVLKDDEKKRRYDQNLHERNYSDTGRTHANTNSINQTAPVNHPQSNQSPPVKKKKDNSGWLAILITAGVFGFLILIGTLGSSSDTGTTNLPNDSTNNSRILASPVPTKTKEQIMSEAVPVAITALTREPSKYKFSSFGKYVTFDGKLDRFFKDKKTGDVFGGAVIEVSNKEILNDNTKEIFISFDKSIDLSRVNEKDTIKFYGFVTGVVESVNASGASTGNMYTNVEVLYINDLTTKYSN
jgi:hypothetical protein